MSRKRLQDFEAIPPQLLGRWKKILSGVFRDDILSLAQFLEAWLRLVS